MPADRDDDDRYAPGRNLVWLRPDDVDENEEFVEPLPLPVTPVDIDPREYVRSLFQEPLLGEGTLPLPAPTLRTAASELFRSSGLYGNAPAPYATRVPGTPADVGDTELRPPSWKLPGSINGGFTTILGNDTAAGPARGVGPSGLGRSVSDDTAAATEAPPSAGTPADAAAASWFPVAPTDPAGPAVPSPLDHPNAQTGLALTAADALIRRGAELIAGVAGGNRAVVEQVVNAAVQWIGGLLPAEYKASAAKTGEAALAEVTQRLDDDATALRRRGAIGTLAHRRTEAEHEHTHAILGGDRANIEEARREAIEAWSAERRARGDGESEINVGARALERAYRKAALRQRLAQLDDAGIDRALSEDEDANAAPTLAHEVAKEIRQIRRDDPARVGEASAERKIAEKTRDGRIDTPEEEARERYKLRLEAQAQRGIPEHERRILTNAERTALATEYLRIASSQGREAADRWLDERARLGGTLAARFKAEVSTPPPPATKVLSAPPRGSEADDTEPGRVEPVQDRGNRAPGDNHFHANNSEQGKTFGQEAQLELGKRYQVGNLPREALIRIVTEVAIRRSELPSNTSIYLWGSLTAVLGCLERLMPDLENRARRHVTSPH